MPRLNNFNKSMGLKQGVDEMFTPPILVKPILDFVSVDKVVWCPFDTEKSEFVKMFRKKGNKVLHSHVWCGQDFFVYEPQEHYDCIISNPQLFLQEYIAETHNFLSPRAQ